jgi:hypothetical protein
MNRSVRLSLTQFTLTGFCTADCAYETDDPRIYFSGENEGLPFIHLLL